MRYPSQTERKNWDSLPVTTETHEALFPHIDALHSIERGKKALKGDTAQLPLRVVSWNQERGRFPEQAAALLAAQNPDVVLLSEMDIGMARTHQRNTTADLATRLDYHYLFGTEFVEFSLGSDIHKTPNHDGFNEIGLHGNSMLSRASLDAPRLIRLEQTGRWFTGPYGGEKRIGGRLAIAATLMIETDAGTTPLVFVSVHLESHTDPDDRATQVATMLQVIDTHYGTEQPVVIGGDFNTNTLSRRDSYAPEAVETLRIASPSRFIDPAPYEPLFTNMSAHGYQWQMANVPETPTQRFTAEEATHAPNGRPLMRLDWLFTRGVEVESPAVLKAFADDGSWLSDHEALALNITNIHSPTSLRDT